jgi:CRISPR-associated protein Cas2
VRYVVCYDIADDQRREHVATILLDFGRRVQESVFVADLDGELAGRMRNRLKQVLDLTADRIHIFRLCVECSAKAESIGAGAELPEDQDFYIL